MTLAAPSLDFAPTEELATRICFPLDLPLSEGAHTRRASCLVRIHPQDGIGQVIHLEKDCQLAGRDETCEIPLSDDSVSRRHAIIERDGEQFTVTDLASTNGTYVNNERVQRHQLAAGDRLRLGNQIFKFLTSDGLEAQYCEAVYKIMTTDGLTQVHNKRYLLDMLDRELARARRSGRPVSILLIDLDRFKRINDTYGHLAGDEVLQEFCRRSGELLRSGEVLARYGGEEFAALLVDATLEEARQVAERLRQVVSSHPFKTEGADIPVTVSIGVATTSGSLTSSQLLAAGDRNLYAAKNSGRNRVVG